MSANNASFTFEQELAEWLDSLDYVLANRSPQEIQQLLHELQVYAYAKGIRVPFTANTPYINTIPAEQEQPYPGNLELEQRIRSIIRWNAMAMVVRANRQFEGIGGHISTFASAATLYEVGFHHFFRAPTTTQEGDLVYFQGHASPGIYARAFLEGRLTEEHLNHFRRETQQHGLSSYPHPWLMPDFWQFPTVSMGLTALMAIYQARFQRYLEDRGLKTKGNGKIWAFLGDGEMDEPESLGAITLASREKLDNLIFVVNCNLQRLDGPVRGNGKIIQELEAAFRGAGWHVIKVIWGSDWDALLAQDQNNTLLKRMNEVVDGQYQKYTVAGGAYIREHFFGNDSTLQNMVEHFSDSQLERLRRGGHDPVKVYNAYAKAVALQGAPTVILAKTIKGYGLGEAGEGRNITHQQKKLNTQELQQFRDRFNIPINDDVLADAPFYKPAPESPELKYLQEQRRALGGYLPQRKVNVNKLIMPNEDVFQEALAGSEGRAVSTTMAFVRILAKCLKDPAIGKWLVPIVPDEARTFGMEALFRQCGIYSHVGQLYEPVDADNLLYYKEAQDGQILEEGITEAGALASFIAAGTAYATRGVLTIPVYLFYSMFGFQRVGDLIWAAADLRTKGFLIGATAGRTTLNGEGLQHQDGQSHLLAYPVPNLQAYDLAFAYEIAVVVRAGLQRMYVEQEDIFYYITVANENYAMPSMPAGVENGILRGIYCFKKNKQAKTAQVQLLGSGAILMQVLAAQDLLEQDFQIAADVFSVTSYKALYDDGNATNLWNQDRLDNKKTAYLTQVLSDAKGIVVAASDYVKALPYSIQAWCPLPLYALGTDGFGRSDTREALRDYFAVDAKHIAYTALLGLVEQNQLPQQVLHDARQRWQLTSKQM